MYACMTGLIQPASFPGKGDAEERSFPVVDEVEVALGAGHYVARATLGDDVVLGDASALIESHNVEPTPLVVLTSVLPIVKWVVLVRSQGLT